MQVWIEVGAERFDRPHASLSQDVVQLRVDQLDALLVCRVTSAGVNRQGAVEIVDDQQQLLQEIGDPLVGEFAAFALDTFAVIVELGRFPQPSILVVVALALKFGRRVRRKRRFGGLFEGRLGERFVSHVLRSIRGEPATPLPRRHQP